MKEPIPLYPEEEDDWLQKTNHRGMASRIYATLIEERKYVEELQRDIELRDTILIGAAIVIVVLVLTLFGLGKL